MIAQASSDPNFTGAGDSLTSSGYRWNVYLGLALPSADAIPQPTGFDLSQNMTATQYWAVMGPALTQAYGLAGFMAGLGASACSIAFFGDTSCIGPFGSTTALVLGAAAVVLLLVLGGKR
jgi:hypothetical protein